MKIQLFIFAALYVASSLQNEITPIWKNNKLTTIPHWGKEYRVSFEIRPLTRTQGWTSIVHFTAGGNCCKPGQRIPAVWFQPGTIKLAVSSAVNSAGNFVHSEKKPLAMNKFTRVVVQQFQNAKGVYVYKVIINGKVVQQAINTKSQVFKNVKVYAGSPFYPAGDAVLRNFQYTVEPEFTGNVKRGRLMKTIPRWGKEWRLSFRIKPLSAQKGWTSILHLTTGKNSGTPGSRIPAIWLQPNTMKLAVSTQLGTNNNYVYSAPKNLPITKYTNVQIQQLMDKHGKYIYKIIINGKVVHSALQKNPTEYKNVKLYASDPWYPHADVYVRDLHLVGITGQHYYTTL